MSQVNNRVLALIGVSMLLVMFMENFDPCPKTDFIRGFFTGTGMGGLITALMVMPFGRRINNRIKRCVKELYMCE